MHGAVQWMLQRVRRKAAFAALLILLAGCTPEALLVSSLVPAGAVPVLLSHLERVEDRNRRHIVELEAKGDWSGIAKFAEANLARDRFNADWWTVAGYAYTRLGQHGRAVECYAETVRLAPEEILGWNLLAEAYRVNKQPEHAVRTLQNALLVKRNSPWTFFLLGESYRDLRRDEPAVEAYRGAIELDNSFAYAWLGMGRAYARLGRRAEVAKARQVLEKLNPALARELDEVQPGR